MIQRLRGLRDRSGRLFIAGVGGSAANASHAVNDFRKIGGIESYTPTDNVAELTAWINDESWETSIVRWLEGSRFRADDALLILSVGGGSDTTSRNLVAAMDHAKEIGAELFAIVGRDGGHAAQVADITLLIPPISDDTITPLAESFQAIVWHLLVTGMNSEDKP
jgi:D-sedoheptulose 7-phosphate isomerase